MKHTTCRGFIYHSKVDLKKDWSDAPVERTLYRAFGRCTLPLAYATIPLVPRAAVPFGLSPFASALGCVVTLWALMPFYVPYSFTCDFRSANKVSCN